jgi:hypothetical protein
MNLPVDGEQENDRNPGATRALPRGGARPGAPLRKEGECRSRPSADGLSRRPGPARPRSARGDHSVVPPRRWWKRGGGGGRCRRRDARGSRRAAGRGGRRGRPRPGAAPARAPSRVSTRWGRGPAASPGRETGRGNSPALCRAWSVCHRRSPGSGEGPRRREASLRRARHRGRGGGRSRPAPRRARRANRPGVPSAHPGRASPGTASRRGPFRPEDRRVQQEHAHEGRQWKRC